MRQRTESGTVISYGASIGPVSEKILGKFLRLTNYKREMKMRRFLVLALFTSALALIAGCNSAADTDTFFNEAAQGGITEVQAGNIALTKAQSPQVRAFAQKMVTDHSQANAELQQIAARRSVKLPTEPTSSQKDMISKLSQMSGAEFDKEYVSEMVTDHEKDVKAFQTQAEKGTDADLKAFAAKTLPTLQAHLQMIRDIKAKM